MRRITTAAVALLFMAGALLAKPTLAEAAGERVVSLAQVYVAIAAARTVTVSAYTLSPNAPMLRALEFAAARGAHVDLILTGDGMDYAVRDNREIVERERAFHVALTQEPLHLKCVVLNGGQQVFVTDRNFAAGGMVWQLPSTYALAVERAALGDPHDVGNLTLTKGASLDVEARLIASARRSVSIETESFSDENPVYDALVSVLRRGVAVTLIVARREASEQPYEMQLLHDFQAAGVHVYLSDDNQKLALVDGNRIGWFGSSNSTRGVEGQVDFGYTTTDPNVLGTIARSLRP